MNKIYPLILSLLVGAAAMAADTRPRSGMITISLKENTPMRVSVDGRNYSDQDNDVSISNVAPGYHNIQVFRVSTGRSPFDIFGRNREQLLWSNSLYVSAGKETDITINKNGKAKVKEVDMPFNAGYGNDRRDNDDRYDRDHNGGYNNGRYPNNGGYGNGSNGGYGNNSSYGVSFQEMQSMKETLMRERYENTRVSLARDMFNGHAFSSAQVRELLQQFSFENNKLDLAKYAYRNVIDKSNYYVVFDVFSSNFSKQELSNYMSSYR
jgi:Domain of unknown function (DUF4476)